MGTSGNGHDARDVPGVCVPSLPDVGHCDGRDVWNWLNLFTVTLRDYAQVLDGMDLGSGLDNYTGSSAYATMVHAVGELDAPQGFSRLSWGMNDFAAVVHRCAHGVVGVLLAAFFARLAKGLPVGALATPADMMKAVVGCRDVASDVLLPQVFVRDPDTLASVWRAISDDVAQVASSGAQTDMYGLSGRVWSVAQDAFVDAAEENQMRADARAAVIVLLWATLTDSLAVSRGIPARVLPTSVSMFDDMHVEPLPAAKRYRGEAPFVVRYMFRGDERQAADLRTMFVDRDVYGAMSGMTDILGFGVWQVVVRTQHPLSLIPAAVSQAIVSHPVAQHLTYGGGPRGPVVSFEPVALAARDQRELMPPIVAVTRAPGLIEHLARGSAIVFFDRGTSASPVQATLGAPDTDSGYTSISFEALLEWLPESTLFVAPCDTPARTSVLDALKACHHVRGFFLREFVRLGQASPDTSGLVLPPTTPGGHINEEGGLPTNSHAHKGHGVAGDRQVEYGQAGHGQAEYGQAGHSSTEHTHKKKEQSTGDVKKTTVVILPTDDELAVLHVVDQWSSLAIAPQATAHERALIVEDLPVLHVGAHHVLALQSPSDIYQVGPWVARHIPPEGPCSVNVLLASGQGPLDAQRITAMINGDPSLTVDVFRGGQHGATLVGLETYDQ